MSEAFNSLGISKAKRFFLPTEDRKLLAQMEAGLDQVEVDLVSAASSVDQLADQASKHLIKSGGKRVRPMLALLSAQLGNGVNDQVLKAAIAVELTHVASLYHDDVMDEADTRRGSATAHRLWGNNVAILAGDILFARASVLMSGLGARAIEIQSRTFDRLCQGQLRETIGPAQDEDPIQHYINVLADKTGSLIAAAGQLGALLAGAPEEYLMPISSYGENIGVAFQLVDDVIDLRSSSNELGKTAGTDLREGVPTLPMLLLRQAAQTDPAAAADLQEIEALIADDGTLELAVRKLAANDVTDQAFETAKTWGNKAKQRLDPIPDSQIKDLLIKFADYLINRKN